MEEPDDLKHILIQSGIGPKYLDHSLADYGTVGKSYFRLFKDQTAKTLQAFRDGTSLYFHGKYGREFGMTLAKVLIAKFNFQASAFGLSKLTDLLTRGYEVEERLNELQESNVLLISDFYVKSISRNPLDARDVFRVEDFLTAWMDAKNKVVILTGSDPLRGGSWWSSTLLLRLEEQFVEEEITTYEPSKR